MSKLIPIQLQIEPSVVSMIDKKCGGPSHGGKRGGRAHFIRQLIYQELGFTMDLGWLGRGPQVDLDSVDIGTVAKTDRVCAEVVRLIRDGLSYRDIARHMRDEHIPTPRGGKWTYQTVRNYVKKAIKLSRSSHS